MRIRLIGKDINECFENVFGDIVGLILRITKHCDGCNQDLYKKRIGCVYPRIPFNAQSKNRQRIFCSFEDDFEHRLNGTISKEGCAVHKSNCLGPSKNIRKEFIGCRGNLMVLGTDNNLCGGSQLTIDQIPETYTFANNKFKLVGLIGGNNFHFVSYIKCPKN